MAEDLGTIAILEELSAILVARFQTVRKDGADLSSENCLEMGIHSFLTQLVSGGGPHPRPRAGNLGQGRPGRNGVSLALTIICTAQPVLDHLSSLCLLWRAVHRGPPPVGGYSIQGLLGASIHLRRATYGPRDAPGGNFPARLENDAMQEVEKDF